MRFIVHVYLFAYLIVAKDLPHKKALKAAFVVKVKVLFSFYLSSNHDYSLSSPSLCFVDVFVAIAFQPDNLFQHLRIVGWVGK